MEKKDVLYIFLPTVLVLAVLAITVAVGLIIKGGEESYRSIRVVELKGDVSIDREGVGSLEASVNMNLISGDRISTSADAYVVLRLDEDKYVMLGEQGAIQVFASGNAANGRTQIHLETGTIVNDIQNSLSQDSAYEIVIPGAAMSVRGTVFEVRWHPDNSTGELLTYEGTVALTFQGEEPVLYSHGKYTQFVAGDTPQFLTERKTITDQRMDLRMIPFLYQIKESGRWLDFGEANFEELIERAREEGFLTIMEDSFASPGPTATSLPMATPNDQDGNRDDDQDYEVGMTNVEIIEVSGEARIDSTYPNTPGTDLTDALEKRYLDNEDVLCVFENSYVKLRAHRDNEIILTAGDDIFGVLKNTYGILKNDVTDICFDTGSILINAQRSFRQCTYSLGIKTGYTVSIENAAIMEIYTDESLGYVVFVYEGSVTVFGNEIHSGQYAIYDYDGTNVATKNISDDMSIMEKSKMVWYLVEHWGSGLCFDEDEWGQLAELAGQS